MTVPPNPDTGRQHRRVRGRWFVAIAFGAFFAAIGIGALLTNIVRRQEEASNPFFRAVALTDTTTDPEIWGKNFPQHYDAYLRTVDQQRTRYGGSEALPHSPTDADPRAVVAQSRLEEDPRLVALWAGYAFSKDFREERGHAYMLSDQEFTQRQTAVKQPGSCLNCHASMYATYKRLGAGDLQKGFDSVNATPYFDARKNVSHPVSCVDCHDAGTMALRITRPSFMEGIRVAKLAQGITNYDVNKNATRQEMRTFVCAQCHVEYYFKGTQKTLTYPWSKGLTADSIMAYYDSTGHRDWVHATSGANALKAQHPEFELYSQGVHARSNVSCSDCHMPYTRSGAMKISDHHVRSPMLNINRSCQTCHKFSEEELRNRVEQIQSRTYQLRNLALDAVLALTKDIQVAVAADSTNPRIKTARDFQRKAQFYVDFIEAENSMGFHAPGEAARVLGISLDQSRRGQVALAGLSGGPEQNVPAGVRQIGPTPHVGPGAGRSGNGERSPNSGSSRSSGSRESERSGERRASTGALPR